jgi:hypothetical protein
MTKKIITVLTTALLIVTTATAYQPLEQQEVAHEIAELARSINLLESDPIIQGAQEIWWLAQNEFDYDRDLIATAIYHEAWGGCSDRHRELVGAVIYNRTNSPVWPDTIYEVLAAPKQYTKDFVTPNTKAWNKARENSEIWVHCQSIAEKVLRGEVNCPSNVVYQSNSIQGKIYETHKTSYSTTYFCYGMA